MSTETNKQLFVTIDYLDAKISELRAEIYKLHAEQFKWNMGMFMGLYAVIILGYFIKR